MLVKELKEKLNDINDELAIKFMSQCDPIEEALNVDTIFVISGGKENNQGVYVLGD